MGYAAVRRIVADYQSEAWKYERLARLVARFLSAEVKGHFSDASWPVLHEAQHRAKSPNSLHKNLVAGRYDVAWRESEDLDSSALWSQVKDLAGVRLIFHFRSDLDEFLNVKARQQLARWFGQTSLEVDHMQLLLKDNRKRVKEVFGYSSYHFPVTVCPDTDFWRSLTDDDQLLFPRRFECEVQLRTVLQHAWAEAEHDLRYKGLKSSPREDRLWGIVSAMLEGADYLIAERKSQALPAGSPTSLEMDAKATWVYHGATYSRQGGLTTGGVTFGYLLLHDAKQEPFRLEWSDELFDVDAAMQRRAGISNFKVQMWQQLTRDEPAFVAAMQFDGTVARASGWDAARRVLQVQPALYSDQMVTNHKKALAQTVEGHRVQDLAYGAADGTGATEFLNLGESPLSNTIGVACVLRTTDGQWVIGERAATLAYEPNLLGCSSSGSLAWSEPRHWGSRSVAQWVLEGIARECLEELGYRPPSEQIKYLALCREIERAGKPQLFFFVDMVGAAGGVSAPRLASCWQMYARREHTALHFLSTRQAVALTSHDSDVVREGLRSVGLADRTPSEELRANLALALAFASASRQAA